MQGVGVRTPGDVHQGLHPRSAVHRLVMLVAEPFAFEGYLRFADGSREAVSIRVGRPRAVASATDVYECVIESGLLPSDPYPVCSGLEYDAVAAAFELLNDALRRRNAQLVDEFGAKVELPSPRRDRSWVPLRPTPDVSGIEPIFRVEGWANIPGEPRQRVELAVWPPSEIEPGTFCAPERYAPLLGTEVRCTYGASAEQAVYFAYSLLQVYVEVDGITDDDGNPIAIPLTPNPALPD